MIRREAALQALKKGEWISAGVLGEILEVPVAMVEGVIQAIQAEGYEVDLSPDKGYRLRMSPDLLSPVEVCSGLTSHVFGREHYFYYQEIDSTNNRALELASAGYPEGTVVVAEMQTAGKGRRGRSWYSPAEKGIYVSIILRPPLPLHEISRVSLVIAVAVAETLEKELSLPARIKWPNDILINKRKIAGILSEAAVNMNGIQYIVTGIGLNINNSLQDFPGDLRTDPTSVLVEKKRPVSRVKILQRLLTLLEAHYFQLLEGDFAGILKTGKSLSLVLGQEVKFDTASGPMVGRAVDLDENGSLLVRDEFGVVHAVISGEINILSASPGGKKDSGD